MIRNNAFSTSETRETLLGLLSISALMAGFCVAGVDLPAWMDGMLLFIGQTLVVVCGVAIAYANF